MASKWSTGKNTSSPNQPPSLAVNDSISEKPIDFSTFDFFGRYSSHIPSQSTPNPTLTCSPKNPDRNQYSSSNEELRGVTPEEPLYHIPNNEVD